MAIQISGTTVINNSRQLQNIASADSTTQNTINSFVSGGDVVIPDDAFTTIFDVSSASLSAGTYFVWYTGYISSNRTFNFPTTNVTGGMFFHANPRDWYFYNGSNWIFMPSISASNTATATSVGGAREQLWGWFKCNGTTSVSLSGGPSQRLVYNKLD